jgi:Tol biopolymer transport system component
VAAKALLQIGKCYEKLGSLEARKAYETLLKEYADQGDIATEARARLSALTRSSDDSGIRMRQVWASSAANSAGSLSPDGRFLLYIDWNSGGNVAIRELASGKSRLITTSANGPDHFARNPKMSPDGKWIAYQWQNEEFTYDLRVVGIDGLNPRIVYVEKSSDIYPQAWSPDGEEIVIGRAMIDTEGNSGYLGADVALVNIAQGTIRILKPNENVRNLVYSPDGKYLAYDFEVAEDSGKFDISLLALDEGKVIPLIRHPANDRLLGWIPGTNNLVFRSNRSGTDDLFVLHLQDGISRGAPEVIKRAIGEIAPVGFANDGSFYYSIYTRSASLRVAPFDMRSGKIQLENAKAYLGSNMSPKWSPDGSYLVFSTERNELTGPGFPFRFLRVRNMETGDIQEVAAHLMINSSYCWTPDGRAIIVRGRDRGSRGKYGIYEVEIPGGRASLLFELTNEDAADVIWTKDRKAVIYSRGGSITMRDLETNREKVLLKQPGLSLLAAISPDGEYLPVMTGRKRLQLLSLTGGAMRELTQLTDQQTIFGGLTWTPDGKYLVFSTVNGQGFNSLFRISLEGGDPEKLWESKDLIASLSIHPDGRQIALSTLTQVTEIWVMENLIR